MNKLLPIRYAAALTVCALLTGGARAATATVNAQEGLRLRSEPSTSSQVLEVLSSGAQVDVTEAIGDNWYYVTVGSTTGYVASEYVTLGAVEKIPVYGYVAASSLNVRSTPDTSGEKVGSLPNGTKVELLEQLDGWYRIAEGYVSADYIQFTEPTQSSLRDQIVAYAKSLLGRKYVLGGTGPNAFDCSGLVQYVYKHFGYTINRSATQQLKNGTVITKEELQPGDLVFFNSAGTGAAKATHVGVYIGGGQFVHASSPKVGVVISDLYSTYYKRVYTTSRRIL